MKHAPIEWLESRTLFAITFQVDYSYDDRNFFNTPEKRAVFQAAVDAVGARLGDQLAAIEPSGGNTWTALLSDPSDEDGTIEIENLTVPANTMILFVGAAPFSPLAIGGPGAVQASGSTQWRNLVENRGQTNTEGPSARDFGPYGGVITFDTSPVGGWYFGLEPSTAVGAIDFYSVAMHELGHVLGIGISDSWDSRVSGDIFSGTAAIAEYDSSGSPPLNDGHDHWQENLFDNGQEVAMDPDLEAGQRKLFTPLDFAGLDDIGWELPIIPALDTSALSVLSSATSARFTVDYTHYATISASTLNGDDITVTGPNGFSANASFVSSQTTNRVVSAVYEIAAPGGTFASADIGSYTVSVNEGSVTDSRTNLVHAASLGSFSLEVESGPLATFAADDVKRLGGTTNSISVTYTDTSGIDVPTIDVADITVTRGSDTLALAVTSATVTTRDDPNTKTVTYVAAAPGGLWDTGDNGTYTVSLAASQVADSAGSFAEPVTLGTFDVAIIGVPFSSGSDLAFTDATGDAVVMSLKGPGSGLVFFDTEGNADAALLVLNNVGVATSLTVTAGGNGTPIGEIEINGSLKTFTLKNADLAGDMVVTGAIPKLAFRNASGSIALNGNGAPVTLTLAQASELSLTSAAAIKSLKLNDWLDADATPDLITTPVLSTLAVKGTFAAGISAGTIGKVTAGSLNGSEIRATSALTSVTATSASNSTIFAGVRSDLTTLPDSTDDFAAPAAAIKTITIKGKTPGSFSNTLIAGGVLGKISLGAITSNNTAIPFGVAGLTIKSASGTTDSAGPLKRSKLDDPSGSFAAGDFNLRLL